jgi:hypothetical protein
MLLYVEPPSPVGGTGGAYNHASRHAAKPMRRLMLGIALLWGGLGLLAEMSRAVGEHDRRDRWFVGRPEFWRFDTPEPAGLERCLAGVRQVVPPVDPIAFASAGADRGARFFEWRWASWLLPAYDVAPWEDVPRAWPVPYIVSRGARIEDARYELIRRSPECEIYRVRRP